MTYGLTKDGRETKLYELTNKNGAKVVISDLGGIITNLWVPDKEGVQRDVVLACANASDYEDSSAFMGALIGRFANRIAKGQFSLNGIDYQLAINNGVNHLHGGEIGFDKYIWQAKQEGDKLTLTMESPDMDEQYPGNMKVEVIYTFDDESCLTIDYSATSDKDTICNLTNHVYFNLEGHDSGDIKEHMLRLNASNFTPTDDGSIPTGEIASVEATPFDFRQTKAIGQDIATKCQQIEWANGFDHNFVLDKEGQELSVAAEVYSPISGITMTCETTQPGVQFYTGNFIGADTKGKDDAIYQKRSGFCLETQNFPDAINHENFPTAVLKAGEIYKESTKYRFGIV